RSGDDHSKGQDSHRKKTGLKRFKKENKLGSGKDDFASARDSTSETTSAVAAVAWRRPLRFDGGKGSSSSRHKEEKIEKIIVHLKTDKKYKAAAKVNADAKFKVAAAHETFHRNALLAKKIAAEKKKGGFNWLF
ncbi:hypothetical protein CF328_g4721, partial [Tilletia controversa]